MSRLRHCCRLVLGFAFLSAAFCATAETQSIDVGSPADFLDVTSRMTYQPAASEAVPDPSLFLPVSRDDPAFERYDRAYWFRLEFVNHTAVPAHRLPELTHGRLGTLVARLQSEDTDRELLHTGAGMPIATRGASFPNGVIRLEVWPNSHATLLIYAASRDNMVMSARLWSESGFSSYQLRHEMIVGAGLGALLVLGIYNLVVFLITLYST